MRTIFAATLSAIVMTLPASAAPTIGKIAPDFTVQTTSGENVTLSELDGIVVLEWTNHGCPFVKKHYESGNMQSIQKSATDDGVTWVTIISSAEGKQGYVSAEKADKLTADRGASPSYTILDPSGEVGRLYKAKTTPQMFIIEDKNLVYAGAIDSIPSGRKSDIEKAENYVESAFADIKAGKAVRTPVTQPYGCNVKYGS